MTPHSHSLHMYSYDSFFFFVLINRMVDLQKPATTIKMAAGDPLYLSFLPALDTAMVAAWHEPKVRQPGRLFLIG